MKSLTDSCLKGEDVFYLEGSGAIMEAIDELRKQYGEGEINIVSLRPYGQMNERECPIRYEVQTYTDKNGKRQPDKVRLYTSHYVGSFSYKGINISIKTRFTNEIILNHLLGYAANIYMPIGSSKVAWGNHDSSRWIAAILWKALLDKALSFGQIPKEYQHVTHNQKHFRGRLIVPLQIRANLCDASRFYCAYNKLSVDTTINRVVRTVYHAFKKQGFTAIVNDLDAYDERLEAMGVQACVEDVSAIDYIRYTKMNAVYQPVMKLSKTILSSLSAVSKPNGGKDVPLSYFVDMAELWELYLLRVLRKGLPAEFHVYSPNSERGLWLLQDNIREIRPDILIEHDGRVVMVIDAKYKWYTTFGRTALENGSVSRDDLYQMCTYLYHYGQTGQHIVGLFTSPQKSDEKAHHFTHDDTHSIGLLNLNIAEVNNLSELRDREADYVDSVKELLMTLSM